MKEVSTERFLKVIPILIYLLSVYFLAYLTEEALALVLLGMMPALLNMLILVFFDVNREENHLIVFLSPIFLGVIFIVLWMWQVNDDITAMSGPAVAFLNVLLGYFMILFFIRWNRTAKVIQEGPLGGDTLDLMEKIKQDAVEMDKLRLQIVRYEQTLAAARKASKAPDVDVRPLQDAIVHYEAKARSDAEELERLKRILSHKQLELDSTKIDAQVAESKLHPLKQRIAHYESRVDLGDKELARLRKLVDDYAHALHMTKQQVNKSIRSVEDKCKALNFVIGRVYSDKKGGSAAIRSKIQIPRKLYNDFSELLRHPKKADPVKLLNVLNQLMYLLDQMELKESDVFKIKKARVPVDRKSYDTILAVLAKNDKDPVSDYHSEAKHVCRRLLDLVEKGKLD